MNLQILSLQEIMNQYNVWQLVRAVEWIRDLENMLAERCQEGFRDAFLPYEYTEKHVKPRLEFCREQCEVAELHTPLRRLGGVLHGKVNARAISNYDLMVQLQELRTDIVEDLRFRRFALVPFDKTEIYDKGIPAWQTVWKRFPKAEHDTREAIDSYVLGLNTATVFHAMRIAEMGLRALARRLRVTVSHKKGPMPIDLADWEAVITACRNEITRLRTLAKGHKSALRLQLYSEAAEHCGFMKDIYRNPVSHARKVYNAGEALGALTRVYDFMQFLATAMGRL